MTVPSFVSFISDPIAQFREWFALAQRHEISDPEAMSLSTCGVDGMPHVRIVLCKSFDAAGIRFFTNTESNKGRELGANPRGAVCFHWKSIERQVRAGGVVEKLPAADDDQYFHDRHRESQIGAWASRQSRPLESMEKLQTDVRELHKKYADRPVPRPPYWGGYLLRTERIEFWVQRPHRLHERMLYTRDSDGWRMERLYP